MKAAFFRRINGGELQFIAYAKTNNPKKEFKLLIGGEIGDPFLFQSYGNTPPPSLDESCVMGVGRNKEEAQLHIVSTVEE